MGDRFSGTAVVVEKFREFDRVATQLEMPLSERLNILNVTDHVYQSLTTGKAFETLQIRPELERRLNYALPLMRRLAGNSAVARSSASHGPTFGMSAA